MILKIIGLSLPLALKLVEMILKEIHANQESLTRYYQMVESLSNTRKVPVNLAVSAREQLRRLKGERVAETPS